MWKRLVITNITVLTKSNLILYLITEISLITFFYIDFRRDDSNLIFLKTVISVSLFVFLIDILISLNLGFYI